MIYPTARGIALAGVGIIIALLISALSPQSWAAGLGWLALVAALLVADALAAPSPSSPRVKLLPPASMMVGRPYRLDADISFPKGVAEYECALEASELLSVAALEQNNAFSVTPLRRGRGRLEKLWVRWRGPLGLVSIQTERPIDVEIIVSADTQQIEDEALAILTREFMVGDRVQIDQGDGSEFDSLRDFQIGMDTRAIDWKQTARHRTLLTRQYRTERNHSIVFAIDSGRLMSAPVNGGLSRLDHSINAALFMTFVSLKLGDRVGLFSFDKAPRIQTGMVGGPRAFPLLQKAATEINYTSEEPNYTLALASLSAKLDRRTLIIIFTDFADSTSAEIMLSDLGALAKRHLIVFVAFRDDELEVFTTAEPKEPSDITKAVIAETLLRERDLVLARLQRLGAEIVDAPSDKIGGSLINTYLRIKRRNLL